LIRKKEFSNLRGADRFPSGPTWVLICYALWSIDQTNCQRNIQKSRAYELWHKQTTLYFWGFCFFSRLDQIDPFLSPPQSWKTVVRATLLQFGHYYRKNRLIEMNLARQIDKTPIGFEACAVLRQKDIREAHHHPLVPPGYTHTQSRLGNQYSEPNQPFIC
jgi:hypothetical protein